jgi:uncharacterized protein (DUF2147 family)
MNRLTVTLILLICCKTIFAQKDQIEHIWYNEAKTSKIEMYKAADGRYFGRIVWLKIPNDKNGKPRIDIKNPDNKLQSRTLLNLIILKDFAKSSNANVYENGSVYDPDSGKTYCGKITFTGKELKLRGYICSFSLLGRSSTWTLAE